MLWDLLSIPTHTGKTLFAVIRHEGFFITIQYLLVTQLKFTRVKINLLLEVSQAEVDCKISNDKRLIYAPHIKYGWSNTLKAHFPSSGNKTRRPLCLLPFFSSHYLSLFLKLNSASDSTPNFQLLWWGRLVRRPLLGPINLWWEQWLITREQEKIRPLHYWWFIIHFWGVNGEPYLSCQCLIYTFCSCTKSPAVFSVQRKVLMEGVEGQVTLGCLPRTGLCFWVFFALWSHLDIQLVDNSFTLNLAFHLSPLVSPWVLFCSVFQSFSFIQHHYLSASDSSVSFFQFLSLCISLFISFSLTPVHVAESGSQRFGASFFVVAGSCCQLRFTVFTTKKQSGT